MTLVYKKLVACVIISAAVLSLLPAAGSLEGLFNSNLSEEGRASLASGDVVVNALSSSKKLCIQEQNEGIQKVLDKMGEFKPNYIAEVIKVYPAEGNEDFIPRFDDMIMNIPAAVKIPYYSKLDKKDEKLDITYKTLSLTDDGGTKTSLADFGLVPFGIMNIDVAAEQEDASYYYTLTNLSKIKYKDVITCVGKGNMKLALTVFKNGDSWVLYGFVAASAPRIIFIRKIVEAALVERVDAFCSYFFNSL